MPTALNGSPYEFAMRAATFALSFCVLASLLGCRPSSSTSSTGLTGELGGNSSTGGSRASSGSATSGGTQSGTTGAAGSHGGTTAASGGNSSAGSTSSSAGLPATAGSGTTGGSQSSGGSATTGGNSNAGGTTGNGGSASAGGTKSTGGTANTGGTKPVGGSSTAGGSSSTAGTSSAGGSTATGGSSSSAAGSTTGGSLSTAGASTAGGSTSSGGNTSVVGGSSAQYFGFQPVPNSQNTANFNPATWYSSWKSKLYVDCGGGQARIANGQGSNNTVSEGIGYGMLLAVGNGDKTALDALWAYYKARVDANGLMNWSINACDTGNNNAYAATDADEDVAMALVQADAKWSGYKTDATNLINLIKKYETAPGPPSYLRPGDATGGWAPGVVNPSYFAPGYWHVWATYVGDTFWNQLAADAYTALAAYQSLTISGSTGALVPEWGTIQGQVSGGPDYGYNACRTPWRVAVDYAWFGTAAAQTFLQHVSTYVDSKGGVASVPFDKNSAFLGPFALSGMAVSQAKADTYLNAWLSTNMDDTPYFQGSLRGLFLLLANHAFPKGI
jgi:endo-1,4-beta-D-glucanase Y